VGQQGALSDARFATEENDAALASGRAARGVTEYPEFVRALYEFRHPQSLDRVA
jgi:hypothetical protein